MKQLKGQEDGLNGLTIQDYFNDKALFDEFGRDTSINTIIKAIKEDELRKTVQKLVSSGMDYDQAVTEAKDWMKTQAALHNPDQIAGGSGKVISGLGNKNINSSIGVQWRWNRADDLFKQIYKQAQNIPRGELG